MRPLHRRPQPEHPLQRQRAADAEQQHQAARLQAAPARRMGLPVRAAPGGGGTAWGGGAGSVPAPPRVWDPGRWLPWAPQVRHAAPRGRAAHGDPPRCGGFPEAPRVSQGERGVGGARNGAGRIGVAEQGLPPCRITRCRLYAFLPPPLLTDPPSAPNFPLPGSQLVLEVETPAPWPPPHAPRSPLPLPHGARTPSAQEPPLCPPGARSGRGAASASCLAARRRGALRDRGAGRHLQQGGVRTEPPLGFDRAPPGPGPRRAATAFNKCARGGGCCSPCARSWVYCCAA